MERLNIARFREELANKEIDGGTKSLNEYQYNKMLIEILSKRNKELESSVMEYLETRPDKRDEGGYGLTKIVEESQTTRISTTKTKEYFTRNGLDISEVQETTTTKKHLTSDLRVEVVE